MKKFSPPIQLLGLSAPDLQKEFPGTNSPILFKGFVPPAASFWFRLEVGTEFVNEFFSDEPHHHVPLEPFSVVVASSEGLIEYYRRFSEGIYGAERILVIIGAYSYEKLEKKIQEIVASCNAETIEETFILLQRYFDPVESDEGVHEDYFDLFEKIKKSKD
jgi:hypothetical protein